MKRARILDLGSSDGAIALWLARQLETQGVEARVDGMELNSQAVEIARRRLVEAGLEGRIACGDALAAPESFDAGTYDAVVAFEIIEHLAEPEQLLEVAEKMVKPNGRVYISTPDGVFGEGNNPLHLHAFRAFDLADMLRRRGQLQDMAVGQDGVTVASYTPAPRRGDVAIYCGPGWEVWSPHDVELKGLGGSETAAIRLGQELSELGWVVTVYGDVEQGAFRDVIYQHHTKFDPMERREALIVSRIPELGDRPMNARRRILWMHDTDAGPRLTQQRAEAFDDVLVLSQWHRDHVGGMYPFLRPKLRQVRNGIQRDYFDGDAPARRKRVIYSSSPDRGLDILLELWPEVLEQVPDAELAHCYSAVYDRVAEQDPVVAEHREKIRKLAKQPGVSSLGSLAQPVLAREMRASLVWAHPSYSTPYEQPFHETSCIGAMEAQAAGCLPVASDWGALKETVKVGRLVGGRPLSEGWRKAFVEHIVEGLTNLEVQAWIQKRGPQVAADLGWDGVARHVTGLIDGETWAFEGHVPALPGSKT